MSNIGSVLVEAVYCMYMYKEYITRECATTYEGRYAWHSQKDGIRTQSMLVVNR